MKTLLFFILCLLFPIYNSWAQPTSFGCTETEGFGFYIASETSNQSGNTLTFTNSRLSKIVTSTGIRTTVCTSTQLGTSMNALAYNPQDNFLYAFSRYDATAFSGKLYRIGANCQKVEIPVTGGVISFTNNNSQSIDNAGGNIGSGTFDGQNNLYVNTTYTKTSTTGFTNKLQVINISGNTASVTSTVTLTCPSCTGTSKLHVADIIYDEDSGNIFGSNRQTNKLYTINTSTGVLTEVGNTGITNFILGIYKNKDGNVRALDQLGNIYNVTLSTGGFSLLSTVTGLRSSNADAASGCYESILPVELVSFTGRRKGKHAMLQWETASEKNSDYFEVQRSYDGQTFSEFDRISAAGNTSQNKYYSCEDVSPLQAEFYRLKQVDFDGSEYYTDVIRILLSEEISFKIYPTVVEDKINYNLNPAIDFKFEVFSLHGKKMKVGSASSPSGEIDFSDFNPGIYFIHFTDVSGKILVKEKFLKI